MQYGSKGWQEWVLDEEEGIEYIKYAYVIDQREYLQVLTSLSHRYDAGIQTFDTANVYLHPLIYT